MTQVHRRGAIATTRSPFLLLREAAPAEEVLILTYAASLEFFERFALGEARGLQAATTVISDASMVTVDPVSVRGAGVRYVEARAVCPGHAAFHPKLLIIAGRDHATVAIGSGNLTLAGWHGNEELWTTVYADTESGPSTMRQVSVFLRALADGRVTLSAEAPAVLSHVAELLDGLDASELGPTIVSTLDGPIIDRLPLGPVDELIVYAPFYDAQLAALRALDARLQPKRIVVHVQSETSVDGTMLQRWLDERGAELVWCSDERYRHGKLVEWAIDGRRAALTGSPNLSGPALLRGIGVPGPFANCELGTITSIDWSLAPPAAMAPGDGLATLELKTDPAELQHPGTVLLGATLIDGFEVALRLADDLTATVRVQAHDPDRDWTTFHAAGELTPGRSEYRIPAMGLGASQALRLIGLGGASNEVFISDPVRARRRPVKRTGPEAGTAHELLESGRWTVLYEIAELMRPALLQFGAITQAPSPRADAATADPKPADDETAGAARATPEKGRTLADYLAACAAVIDEASVEWALLLPVLPGLGADPGLEGRTGLLTTEIDDDAADAGTSGDADARPATLGEAISDASTHRKRQLRKFCEGALERATAWPNLMRTYSARLVLNAASRDLWPDDADKGDVLQRMVDMLAAPAEIPTDEERIAISAYVAVALAILRTYVDRLSINDEPTLRYKRAEATGRAMLAHLDPAQVELLVIELDDPFLGPAAGEGVIELAARIQQPASGLAAALELLEEEDGPAAAEVDGALVIRDPLPAVPERDLVRIAGLVDGAGPTIVRGETETGKQVCCVWNHPLLLISKRNKHGRGGSVYRVADGSHPRVVAAGWEPWLSVGENMPQRIADWYPGQPTPAEATSLLELADLPNGAD